VDFGGILSQAGALKSIGPVQFDLVVTHSVQKPRLHKQRKRKDCFRDSTKLGQKK
jgi:hypothetical protein